VPPPEIDVAVDVDPSAGLVDEDLIAAAIRTAIRVGLEDGSGSLCALAGSRPALEVGVRIAGEDEIHRLNRDYRGVDRPTNVLSFSLLEGMGAAGFELASEIPLPLGDVVISYPHVAKQAADLGHSPETELAWLVIHATLQLLGYTHAHEAKAVHMETLERRALSALGYEPQAES